jgi:hypothetical protein
VPIRSLPRFIQVFPSNSESIEKEESMTPTILWLEVTITTMIQIMKDFRHTVAMVYVARKRYDALFLSLQSPYFVDSVACRG